MSAVLQALRTLSLPTLRSAVLRSAGATLILLLLVWALAVWAFHAFLADTLSGWVGGPPWLATALTALAGLAFVALLFAMAMPVLVFVSSLFMPDLLAQVRRAGPSSARDIPEPGLGAALAATARFLSRAVVVYLVLAPLAFIPVVNIVVFATANAYLLGRYNFLLVAETTRARPEALALYRRHRVTVIAAGFAIVALSLVPLVNLLAPSFGTVLMEGVLRRLDRASVPGSVEPSA